MNKSQVSLGSSIVGQKVKFEFNLGNSQVGNQVKIEDSQGFQSDDIFTMQMSKSRAVTQNNSKVQVKKQQGNVKLQAQNGKKTISKKITWTQNNNKTKSIIIQSKFSKNEQIPVVRQPEPFHAPDIWDSRKLIIKSLKGGQNQQNPLSIQNLVPLPAQKHKLKEPEEYRAIGEPVKKKQYRAVVPKKFDSGYDTFLHTRQLFPIDLTSRNLQQVVEICFEKRLLPLNRVTTFLNKSGTKHILIDFLDLWLKGQIWKYNFQSHPFTMADHRRLSLLLIELYPNQYTISYAAGFHINEKRFYQRLYGMNLENYIRLYQTLDLLSGQNWWQILRQKFRGTEHEAFFTVREQLSDPVEPLTGHQDKRSRSRQIMELLGNIDLSDPKAELQKILTNRLDKKPVYTNYRDRNQMTQGEMIAESNDSSGNTSKAMLPEGEDEMEDWNEEDVSQFYNNDEGEEDMNE